MSKPFRAENGRRLPFEEIVAMVRAEYGVELVGGLGQITDCKAVTCTSQYPASSFMVKNGSWMVRQEPGQRLTWVTQAVPCTNVAQVGFLFAMGTGMGSALPQVSGAFRFMVRRAGGEQIAQFWLPVVKSPEWRRDGTSLFAYAPRRVEVAAPRQVLCLDSELSEESVASFGIGLVVVDQDQLPEGEPVEITVEPEGRSSQRWFRLESAKRYEDWNLLKVLELIDAGPGRATTDGQRVFFGDIHVHSGQTEGGAQGCGAGSVVENYEYARNAARLDFFALTDHDGQIGSEAGWEIRKQAVRDYDCPGHFAALLGFEWSSTQYGHRNVYYRDMAGPWCCAVTGDDKWNAVRGGGRWNPDNATPGDLYSILEDVGRPVLTVPHHPAYGYHPMAWETMNPRFDRLVEIYSCWGSSEYAGNPYANIGSDTFEDLFVEQALRAGHHFGFIASSDGHDGCPGFANWPGPETPAVHPHVRHSLGSGRTAVFAGQLTRGAIFDGLFNRRCYATTGEPILLTFTLDGHPMGSEIAGPQISNKPVLRLWTHGTLPLTKLQIIKNGRLLASMDARRIEEQIEITDDQFDASRPNFYYAKVIQRDYEMAWSSPVFTADYQ